MANVAENFLTVCDCRTFVRRGGTGTIIPDTGHMLHVEKANAVADAVASFAS